MKSKVAVSKSKSKSSCSSLSRNRKKLDIRSLDSSFEHLQQSKASFKPARKANIITVKPKVQTVPREVVDKAGDDLSRILRDF
jgi:hypothetical protein